MSSEQKKLIVIEGPAFAEEFDHEGKHLVSPKLLLSRYGIKYTTIRKWCREGCPRIGGRKLGEFPVRQNNRTCNFFNEADAKVIHNFKADTTHDYVGNELAYTEFGFVGSFLWKYSKEGSKHPAICRPIRTRKSTTIAAGRIRSRKMYFRPDLAKIRASMTNSTGFSSSHFTASQAVDAGIDSGRLKHLRKTQRIRSQMKMLLTRSGHALKGYVHNASDIKRELKIISDAKYGMHEDHEGTWRSRSNASSTYDIPAVTLDGYANGVDPHGGSALRMFRFL